MLLLKLNSDQFCRPPGGMNKSEVTLGYDWPARGGFSPPGDLDPNGCGKTFSKGRAAGEGGEYRGEQHEMHIAWRQQSRNHDACGEQLARIPVMLPLELDWHGALK